MNIVEPIFVQCRSNPAEVALAAPGTELNIVSYARLARSVNSICHRVIAAGLKQGDRVALFFDDPLLHAMVLIALTQLGIVTISGRNKKFAWRFEIDAVMADKPFQFPVPRVVLVGPDWTIAQDRMLDRKYHYRAASDDLCCIFLTSGTTGDEKAVALSHGMIAQRIAWQYLHLGRAASFSSRVFIDLGLTTIIGFQLLISTLSRGGAFFLPGEPQATVNALPIYGVQSLFFSTGGLTAFLGAVEKRPQYECGCESVWVGGSVVSASLSERARARLCSNLTIAYGSTEAAEVASMPAQFAAGTPGAAGFVYPHISVEIVDENGAQAPAGREGIVRIKSKLGVNEYLADPEGSARMFRDGWFYPGDLGSLRSDRMLVISGRANAVVNVGGEKINPERIEEILLSHPSVADAAVFAFHRDFGIVQVHALIVPRVDHLDEDDLRAYCLTKLSGQLVPASFVVVREIPKNAFGKIERHKLTDVMKGRLN